MKMTDLCCRTIAIARALSSRVPALRLPSAYCPLPTALCLLLSACSSTAVAQPRDAEAPFGAADAADFLQRLFGEDAPQDADAVAGVEISVREEREYGDQAAEAYLRSLKREGIRVVNRGRDVAYLRKLVEAIRPQMRNADRYERIRVYLADDPRTDARAFPGGTLVFFRGMLEFAESEAALVGVIGHELSHLDRGHQLHHLRRMKLARESLAGGDPRQFLNGGVALMRMFTHPFRPEDEAAADRDGATWAYRAGYDPRQLAALFLRAHRRDQDQPDLRPEFLRTHPFHIERQQAIAETYDELSLTEPRDDLYVGVRNLRERVPRGEKEFEE